MPKRVLITLAVLIALLAAVAGVALYRYPKAQIASATHQLAPDFTLADAEGKPFTLSSQRGHKVILYFYRGYW